jgi:poly-beta-1,6-N-acetyl-D-glucosamine N-deacetylase
MALAERKKTRLVLWAALLVLLAGSFIIKNHFGRHGMPSNADAASVAEAMVDPESEAPPGARRLLGAQVLVFRSKDYEELKNSIMDLKHAGVNTIIVRAFQNPGDRIYPFAKPQSPVGAYFQTTYAPVVDPVLERIVAIGHRFGMKVFAWMETRKMPLHLPDPQGAKTFSYCFETASLKTLPLWSIFEQAVRAALTGLYRDVALTGVDGILFQDDLIMYRQEDLGARAVAEFERDTGKLLDPEELFQGVFKDDQGRWCVSRYSDTFWLWAYWKNQKLLKLAQDLIQSAKTVNPHIEIAMNFMYESVTAPQNALAWMSQSLAEAAKLPIDYFAIMAYHRQIKKELQLSEEAAYEQISKMTKRLLELVDDPHKILMKVQMTDWKTRKPIPSYEADKVFENINGHGRVSLAFIPYSASTPLDLIGHHFFR